MSASSDIRLVGVSTADKSPTQVVEHRSKEPIVVKYPFWFGGSSSSLAACVTHPLDLSRS